MTDAEQWVKEIFGDPQRWQQFKDWFQACESRMRLLGVDRTSVDRVGSEPPKNPESE